MYQRKKEDDKGENALVLQMEKREKKKGAKLEIIKILVCKCYNNRVYMHGYFSSFAFLYTFTLIDVSFFFWVKMCKMDYFLYFARFSMD